MATADDWVLMGRIVGVFGVRGWVKVFSDTAPRAGIIDYRDWHLRRPGGDWTPIRVLEGRTQGKGVIVRLAGCDDRDQAQAWVGAEIAVRREQLAEPEAGEYYWADLVGLAVSTLDGVPLGRVDHLIETGANDVLVVQGERERLIPYDPEGVVREIDLEQGWMRVDWDPDF